MRTRRLLGAIALLAACDTSSDDAGPPAMPPAESLGLGRPATSEQVAAVDIDVGPTGVGLPPGEATATSGASVYMTKCAPCHGDRGQGVPPSPPVVGRIPGDSFPFGRDGRQVKTVGNYWPYATTLFDYTRRAMPITEPGTLEPEEVYGVVAWILAENGIIGRAEVMNAETLPRVRMPSRDRFVRDDRGGRTVK